MIDSTLYTDINKDRGVSPVIATILMVAITVILAAVIGSFVLGIGGDLSQSPQVSLDVSDAADDVDNDGNPNNNPDNDGPDDIIVIEHNGGDSLESSNLELTVTNTSGESYALEELPGTITTGDRITLAEIKGSGAPRADAEVGGKNIQSETSIDINVRIVHKPSDSLLLDTQITIQ